MDYEQTPLRTVGPLVEPTTPPGAPGADPPPLNPISQLVADLIEATGLIAADKLAIARGRAGQGSLAQALVAEGFASGEGVARTLAEHYHLPHVDLALAGVAPEASRSIPLRVLERVVAIPYALADGQLRVAVAEPQNIRGLDELRLATRHPLEIGVAPREDILIEIRRLVRASE
ncbi:MAG: hypothetical protein M3321_07025, partial [Actinomycetota bacterium]|nr:hypothetical protein [Actinomycetota bacterium]